MRKILTFFITRVWILASEWGNKWGDDYFMRCAVYVRVSTGDQRDNGYSIDSQLRMIKEYCEKNDYI